MAIFSAEMRLAVGQPDRMVLIDRDLSAQEAYYVAVDAVSLARLLMPRVTGRTASRLQPISGEGWFGVWFPDAPAWFMEHGTKPFTMNKVAGKLIPMWVDDRDGSERAKNPKIKVRTTEDGRTQVLIFRKAANKGQRKMVSTPGGGSVSVPMSYPGAPGRITLRQGESGRVAPTNVGVRWRHPGVKATNHINQAISEAAISAGSQADTIYVLDGASWESALDRGLRGLI